MRAVTNSDRPATIRVTRNRPVGLATRLFGCHHKHLSLPRSNGSGAYRECVRCGARRNFNPDTWQTLGPFYFVDQR
ncbi:MAG: hypothetical protein ABIP75_06170 [Pyrinomonadaceae bacterium]